MKTGSIFRFSLVAAIGIPLATQGLAQVNSGSDGSDGALNPTSDLVIDMHDHPDGIYQYTSVNVPSGVTVSFMPNAANTPVVWLVQDTCIVAGTVDVSGKPPNGSIGGAGGPGGYRGGNGPPPGAGNTVDPGSGQGPGGGKVTPDQFTFIGGSASYGTSGRACQNIQHPPGDVYGGPMLLPLLGGSGGGGTGPQAAAFGGSGGGGGGGAILIAASGTITVVGQVKATGAIVNGPPGAGCTGCAPGSGGAIRLVATNLTGSGQLNASGAYTCDCLFGAPGHAGVGRIRIEAQSNTFAGSLTGVSSIGFAGIILLPANQDPSLAITSIGGIPVPAGAVGSGAPVDVMIPGQQTNPMTVSVACRNIPLNSDILIEVRPLSGAIVTATGQNTTGTTASSTATISLNLPAGEGYISARTTTTLTLASAERSRRNGKRSFLLETGLAANGERFKSAEVRTTLGKGQEVVLITESGRRFPLVGGTTQRSVITPATRPG